MSGELRLPGVYSGGETRFVIQPYLDHDLAIKVGREDEERTGYAITRESAIALRNYLDEFIGDRPKPKPTTLEQFQALPVGTIFRHEIDGPEIDSRVKTSPNHYLYLTDRAVGFGPTQVDVTSPNHWYQRGAMGTIVVVPPVGVAE